MDNPGQSASNFGLSHDFFNEIEEQTKKVSFEEQMVNSELPEDWSSQFEEHKKVDGEFFQFEDLLLKFNNNNCFRTIQWKLQ